MSYPTNNRGLVRVDRTRVRAVHVVVELDEPDGTVTRYETHGRMPEAGNAINVKPEYGNVRVGSSNVREVVAVSVSLEALLTRLPDEQASPDLPLFRITEGEQPGSDHRPDGQPSGGILTIRPAIGP